MAAGEATQDKGAGVLMGGMGQVLLDTLLELIALNFVFVLAVVPLSYKVANRFGKHALWLLLLAPIAVFVFNAILGLYGSAVWKDPIFFTLILSIPILLSVALGNRRFNQIKPRSVGIPTDSTNSKS